MGPILKTERLSLAPVSMEHVAALFLLMSDPRLSTYLAWAPHESPAETASLVEALIDASNRDAGYHWAILERGDVRGLVSLIDVRRKHRLWTLNRAEIAYWVGIESQGRGFASEATSAAIDAAFDRLHLNRLIISHTSANPASGRIPQKLGFRFVGTERQFFQKNEKWYDMNHYELLAEEWALSAKDRT